MHSTTFSVLPSIPIAVVGIFYWQKLESDFSCWLNIGENFSILLLLPIVGFAIIGVVALESTSVRLMNVKDMQFMTPELEQDSKYSSLYIQNTDE